MNTDKDMGQDQAGSFDFSSIQEVKLAAGAHKSAAQGMCFMEMVAWFAGEAHSDKPACACIVLGRYGMALNDRMPNDLRDELLKPLVPMIAGTSGSLDDRIARARFLAMWSINKVLSALMRRRGQEALAIACEIATDIPEARAAAQAVRKWADADAADAADAAYAAAAAAYAAAAAAAADAADAAAAAAAYAAAAAADAADAAAYAAAYAYADARREIYEIAVEGLRQAILIGPHEGFDVMIDLRARHAELAKLVAA